jgi:hypothetical protein
MKEIFAAQFFDAGMFLSGMWTGRKAVAVSEQLRRGDEVTDTLRRGSAVDGSAMRRGASTTDTLRRS